MDQKALKLINQFHSKVNSGNTFLSNADSVQGNLLKSLFDEKNNCLYQENRKNIFVYKLGQCEG